MFARIFLRHIKEMVSHQLFFGHMTVSLYCFHNTDMEEQLNQNNKVGIKAMV